MPVIDSKFSRMQPVGVASTSLSVALEIWMVAWYFEEGLSYLNELTVPLGLCQKSCTISENMAM